ncbi:MAG: tetratricopeptide repeat protein [Candidatus Hodarchaeales archaeon]
MIVSEFVKLFEKGQYQIILDKIQEIEVNYTIKDYPLDDQIELIYYKSRALERLGLFEEALNVVTQARLEYKETSKVSVTLPLIEAQISVLNRLGRLEDALQLSLDGDFLIKTHAGLQKLDERTQKWIAQYYNIKGILFYYKGELDTALDFYKQSLTIRETLGNLQGISDSLNNIGNIYDLKGELDTALNYYERSLTSREKIGNLQDIASSLNNIGIIYRRKGHLDKALDFYNKSLKLREKLKLPQDIALSLNSIGIVYKLKGELETGLVFYKRSLAINEEIGNPHNITMSLNNIGEIYRIKGELDIALNYHKRSLELRKKLENQQMIADSLNNIGEIYSDLGELNKALNYHKKSLELREKNGNDINTSESLFNLTLLSLDLNNQELAQVYSEAIQTLNTRTSNKMISLRAILTQAFIWKQSIEFKRKLQAQEVFDDFLGQELIDAELTALAMIHQCELLLELFKISKQPDLLEKTSNLLNQLYNLAFHQQSYTLLITTLLLISKIALLEGKIKKTLDYLDQAVLIAKDKNLANMVKKIHLERERFEKEFERWEEIVKQNKPIDIRIEMTEKEMEAYIKELRRLAWTLKSLKK